jgi:conjugal transfer mating pair stabilization protein TraN
MSKDAANSRAAGCGPKSPDCSGFTVAQLQSLDFSRMDLTEFYAEIAPTLPDVGTLRQKAQQRVNSYFAP